MLNVANLAVQTLIPYFSYNNSVCYTCTSLCGPTTEGVHDQHQLQLSRHYFLRLSVNFDH